MKILELKIPPVFTFIVWVAAMYWLHSIQSMFVVSLPFVWLVSGGCFVASGIFGLVGLYEFKKFETTVHPMHVHKTKRIVNTGIYRFSRNPMYFGLLLLLIAYGYWQQDLLSLFVSALFVPFMNKFQIMPEEKHLEGRFGDEYVRYMGEVRRWI
ncbi:isoprenylcysteine carboxylmethyltransferase family protein [Vibrio sp. JC009]|uniref:methyltransferase family protein n=1 Tax=Vibrio sp. JC009 TaxID=2912314 RepID=UPI0023B0BE10|nr:isoprenylcysteine carboxylmethyltransferase family protein [Vibrio sp. JC009]WED23043.1 isoprenylcysteine carboxylmethyltransferase family protein [Vibrio sp. JC009]